MIKITNNLPSGNCNSAITAKIYSLYKAYGSKNSFCTFWLQTNKTGTVTTIICKYYASLTVFCIDADLLELNKFIGAIGYSEILCNIKLCNGFKRFNTLVTNCSGKNTNTEINIEKARAAYKIFKQYPTEITLGDFEEWYTDLSYRIRHNAAGFLLTNAAAAVYLITESANLLNGIAVNNKGLGEGKKTIDIIKTKLIKGKLFVICSDNVLDFYIKSGFKKKDDIYYLKEE